MKVNKRKFIIIIILLLVLVLIPPVMIIKEVVYWKTLANDTEKKLNQINITELEDKLIAELEQSSINVDNSLFTTEFTVCRDDTYDEAALYLELYYGLNELNNPYDGWILACIKENKEVPKRLYIPLYKIEGKSEGSSNVFNIKHAQPNHHIWKNEYEVELLGYFYHWYVDWEKVDGGYCTDEDMERSNASFLGGKEAQILLRIATWD